MRRQMKRRVQDDRNQGRGVRGDVGIQTMAESLETHLAAPRRRRRYSVGQSARAHVEKRLNGRVYWYYLVCTEYTAGMTITPTPNPELGWACEPGPGAAGRMSSTATVLLSSHPPIRTPPIHLAQTPHTPPCSHPSRTGMDGIKQPQWQGSSALGPIMYLHVVAAQDTGLRTAGTPCCLHISACPDPLCA